jgi:hypothetical protein
MEHDTYDELTAAYALDALDDGEVRAYEEHLAGCEICQSNLAAMSSTAAHLALAAAPADPSPELRDRILDAARAERDPREGDNVVPLRPRGLRARPALAAAAALAACLVVGLGVWNVSLRNDLDEAREAQALRIVPLATTGGSVVVGPRDQAVLFVSDLERAPADKTYEAWVIHEGTAAPAGVFDGGGGVMVSLEAPVPPGAIVAVTVEDREVDQPTRHPFIMSQPV